MLGDLLEKALSAVGVTQELVEAWVGGPCGCPERRQKLNALGYWAKQAARAPVAAARGWLDAIIGRSEDA